MFGIRQIRTSTHELERASRWRAMKVLVGHLLLKIDFVTAELLQLELLRDILTIEVYIGLVCALTTECLFFSVDKLSVALHDLRPKIERSTSALIPRCAVLEENLGTMYILSSHLRYKHPSQ